MSDNFDKILDECIDRVTRGESPEACMADYPEHGEELRPLLLAMARTKAAYSFTPSDEIKRAARQRLFDALDKRRQPSFWRKVLAQRFILATVATVLVLMIAGYFGLRATVFQSATPTQVISAPSVDGNFVFLVSDEVNALADFSNLFVTIDKVDLLKSGGSGSWIEFVPETKEFDLTLLPGDITQELWRGNIPEGDYSRVVIYVSRVSGTLKATGETIEIKLPSDKLQLSAPFQVSANDITSFTYDLTVVHAGNAQGGQKYLLKPQIGQSGASHQPVPPQNSNSPGQDKSKGNKPSATADISNVPSVNNNRKK
jgi:hypothetical protein